MSLPAGRRLSDLCLACGLCCDGSLFRHVVLRDEEAQALADRGLAVQVTRKKSTLPLRCGGLNGLACTLYADRPHGCRAFVCTLGRALEREVVSFEAALSTVREAQARVAALGAALNPPRSADVMRAVREGAADVVEPGDDALLRQARQTKQFLTEHFLRGDSG